MPPHDILVDGAARALRDEAIVRDPLAAGDAPPLLWLRRLPSGDALIVASPDARRDGQPLLGGMGVVPWGRSARLRVGTLRVDVRWHDGTERRTAGAGRTCRLCFGAFVPSEDAVACRCEALFHDDCDRARHDCPACGAPRMAVPA